WSTCFNPRNGNKHLYKRLQDAKSFTVSWMWATPLISMPIPFHPEKGFSALYTRPCGAANHPGCLQPTSDRPHHWHMLRRSPTTAGDPTAVVGRFATRFQIF